MNGPIRVALIPSYAAHISFGHRVFILIHVTGTICTSKDHHQRAVHTFYDALEWDLCKEWMIILYISDYFGQPAPELAENELHKMSFSHITFYYTYFSNANFATRPYVL